MGGQLTHLSLFSGIGGLDLAAEWAGIETVGQCEWAEYPTKVLEKHWPDIPRWKDIRTLTGESFYERTGKRTVDIISGGFPCQPFSVAGKQRGKEDDRYLWPEMVRVIKELRPTWVVGENVTGIIKLALPDILFELETCGYRTRVFHIPASGVGARHHRCRVAIVGYSEHNGLSATAISGSSQTASSRQQKRQETSCELEGASKSRNSKVVGGTDDLENSDCGRFSKQENVCEQPRRAESERTGEIVANTNSAGLQVQGAEQQTAGTSRTSENVQYADCARRKEQYVTEESDKERFVGWGCDAGNVCNATGERLPDRASEPLGGQRTQEQESERPMRRTVESVLGGVASRIPAGMDGDLDFIINHYWDEEPSIPRIATGIEHRVDRLKCLGNAVVPQQFYPIFKAIAEVEKP